MDFLPLPIFPQGSLASSVVTTVWLGVFVVAFFNLRFGWVLSGLVAPGYLAPLLIAKPWAVVAIGIEGILTYALVWCFSEYLSRWGGWSSLFGRDRFFALFLGSIAVRIVLDGWLLPLAGEWLTQAGIQFDYRNNLHSFGLIIVALVANQFWKTGFLRGLPPIIVTVGLTYLLVRYGLMELTNFSISNLSYVYEDIAASMLASPKAYIILIVSAFLASRMNLHYGWDFNGILIPALLALQWYQPFKILVSFAEALVILGAASLILRTPLFSQFTVEGARKLLLFFNVGFAYKFLLGYLLLWFFPQVKVTDYYGFGYLLSTLIAVKMHDKNIVARLTRSTLQTSLTAVVIASLAGFALTFAPQFQFWSAPAAARPVSADAGTGNTLAGFLRNDRILLYRNKKSGSFVAPLPQELDWFGSGVEKLSTYAAGRDQADLDSARDLLAKVGYQVQVLEHRYLYLREEEMRKGWGIYVIDLNHPRGLLVEVPAPLDEVGAADAAISLFAATGASALAMAGTGRGTGRDSTSDPLTSYRTPYQAFHREMARRNVLQVRGYTTEQARILGGERRDAGEITLPDLPSTLWVKGALPEALHLGQLKSLLDTLKVEWGTPPLHNLQRDETRSGFAELVLSRADARRLIARSSAPATGVTDQSRNQNIEGYLQEWILNSKVEIADAGTNLYRQPRLEEMLYLDQEVVTPLLEAARLEYHDGRWSDAGNTALRVVGNAASSLGYALIRYHHNSTGQDYLILAEHQPAGARRYWGTYIFRLGASQPYMVQVPRPLFETNSFEYGVSLFETMQASALLIAGAHPKANQDQTSDLVKFQNRANPFSTVSQAVLRENDEAPMMVIHSRAFGLRPDTPTARADVLVAFSSGATDAERLGPQGRRLLQTLDWMGLDTRFVDGSEETAGYEVGSLPQALYLEQTRNKEFAVLWVSPLARAGYRQQSDNRLQQAQFDAVGIATRETGLLPYLRTHSGQAGVPVPPALRADLGRYLLHQDMVELYNIHARWPEFHMERVIDSDTRHSFLVVFSSRGRYPVLVLNLNPASDQRSVRMPRGTIDAGTLSQFVQSRAAWLELGEDR